jgi:hypothetical protein
MPIADGEPSLMDNLEFMAELEKMDGGPKSAASSTQLLDRVHETEDGLVPAQSRFHRVAHERAPRHRARESAPDRNVYHAVPLEGDEQDEQDDETSVTISARVAALAVIASGLAGVGAAALVFHARLALFFH